MSDVQFLLPGVPQGSVLCSLVFTMYIRLLMIIARRCSIKYYVYADDTQLFSYHWIQTMSYISLHLEHCIPDIRLYVIQNHLRLNDNKQILSI